MNISLDHNLIAKAAARDKDVALALVFGIDDKIGELDWTLRLVGDLIESLENDMPRDQIAEELGFTKY